jgi:predicted DNA-binding protein
LDREADAILVMRLDVGMEQMTILLPEELDRRLRDKARRRGASVAEVAREAIERYLPAERDGRLSFVAVGNGAPRDASERADELVVASIRSRARYC